MADEAQRRWAALVEARRAQMDAAYDELGRSSADFWERRAGRYRQSHSAVDAGAPFVRRVLELLPPGGGVLDVGAGTGRFALPLAREAGRVIAVEPSAAMIEALRESADDAGISNLETVQGGWLDVEERLPLADVVICAHVLYPHAAIGRWLQALERHARVAVAIETVVRASDPAPLNALWRRFHGDERVGQPGLGDLYPVLVELGIAANVAVYEQPAAMWRFATLAEAVEAVREQVLVAATPANDAIIAEALTAAMNDDGDGLTLPTRRVVASVWWETGAPRL